MEGVDFRFRRPFSLVLILGYIPMIANHSASRALHLYRPPPHLPPAMTRFSSLVAIAAVATVTSDALVPGADAARLGTWMMSSEFCPPRRACAAPLPPWHTALPVIERLGVVGRGVWAGWRAGGRKCHDCCTVALLTCAGRTL